MQFLLNKCFKLNSTNNETGKEENILKSYNIVDAISKGVDGLNYMGKRIVASDRFCIFGNYDDTNNFFEDLEINEYNEKIQIENFNFNAYHENNFNKMFNINITDFPIYFYETVFLNFFCSFVEFKDKKKNDFQHTDIMSKVYDIIRSQKYIFLNKAGSIPHQKKCIDTRYKNGDALIYSDNIIAIADGVSSLTNNGINVSNFSNEILKKCLDLYLHRCVNNETFENQNKMIFRQYNLTYKNNEILKPIICRSACSANYWGASTLLFSFLENEKLHIYNIGDCQMLILRLKKKIFKNKYINKIKIKINSPNEILYFMDNYKNIGKQSSGLIVRKYPENCERKCNSNSNSLINKQITSNHITDENSLHEDITNCDGQCKNSENNLENVNDYSNTKSSTGEIDELCSKRKMVYMNNPLSEVNIEESNREDSEIILYIEDKLSEVISKKFEKYLSKQNSNIKNIIFKIQDDDVGKDSNIESDTLISNISSFTKNDNFYEKEKKFVPEKNIIDNSGYRNLLNFFDLNRTDIVKSRRRSGSSVEGKINESEDEEQIEKKKNVIQNEFNENFSELKSFKKKSKKINGNLNNFNDYRFRFSNEEKSKFDIVYKSKIQQHYFNCPYQITFMPMALNNNLKNISQNKTLNSNLNMSKYNEIITKCLKYCEYSSIIIENNDIIISGSDGLFDNLYDDDIMEIIYNNFYVLKYKFIKLKYFIDFYEEYKTVLKKFYKTINNDSNNGICSNETFSCNSNCSNNVKNNLRMNTIVENEVKHGFSNVVYDSFDGFSNKSINKEVNNCNDSNGNVCSDNNHHNIDKNIGLNNDIRAGNNVYGKKEKINHSAFAVKHFNYDNSTVLPKNTGIENPYYTKVNITPNKENKNNHFFNNMYNHNISYSNNKSKFSHKLKGKFFIKIKNKMKSITKATNKENNKIEQKIGQLATQDEKNTYIKKKSINNNNANINNLSKNEDTNFDECVSRKHNCLQESLEQTGYTQSSITNNSKVYDFDLNNLFILHENEKRQTDQVVVDDDELISLRKEKKDTFAKFIKKEHHFPTLVKSNTMYNDAHTTIYEHGYDTNKMKNVKKKKLIVEKKIDCNKMLYEPSDFVIFDKDNQIYFNAKKACDEIIELSTILANQQMNYALLKKRRIMYNKKSNIRNNNGNCSTKVQTSEAKNENNLNDDFLSNIRKKETHLFDKVNYSDIQSNKSNNKIILSPIAEFIFDKYKKYLNMGKPDDTTGIVSIVKENIYNT